MPKQTESNRTPKKKRKRYLPSKSPIPQQLINLCNVTGLSPQVPPAASVLSNLNGCEGTNSSDNILDCLEELATCQTQNVKNEHDGHDSSAKSSSDPTQAPYPSPPKPLDPPGLDQIPNLRIELSRHLHVQTLSSFLLTSCPGLRMPSFERWLLDSKLEERERWHLNSKDLFEESPIQTLLRVGKHKKRSRKPRQAEDQEIVRKSEKEERENARKEKERKILMDIDPHRLGHSGASASNFAANVDPIIPCYPLESDPSCCRLAEEIMAVMESAHPTKSESYVTNQKKANGIVRELCDMSLQACKEIQNLEKRAGKFQRFGWETSNKRKRSGGSSGGGNFDRVYVEWHDNGVKNVAIDGQSKLNMSDDDHDRNNMHFEHKAELQHETKQSVAHNRHQVCSLVYVSKKRKYSSEDASSGKHKPKPFVAKLNASHYYKLLDQFNSVYKLSPRYPIHHPISPSSELTYNENAKHAFHTVLFAMIIRYSSLSGGQQLNDLRGGGMQGAVHDDVFDCLSKWFGGRERKSNSRAENYTITRDGGKMNKLTSCRGTECFASPFNSSLTRFFSAFPSPDIDGHFGSHGDFFHHSMPSSLSSSTTSNHAFLSPGWYQVNPPFSPGVMAKMAQRINQLLDLACTKNIDVTFIVIVPTCKEDKQKYHQSGYFQNKSSEKSSINNRSAITSKVHHAASHSFNQLIESPHCTSHIVLSAREHGYIEGSQHLRPTRFKESQYSTSVIILRSTNKKEIDQDLFEKELRESFASRHAMEIEKRKCGGDSRGDVERSDGTSEREQQEPGIESKEKRDSILKKNDVSRARLGSECDTRVEEIEETNCQHETNKNKKRKKKKRKLKLQEASL